jgi:hypothetical protein
VLVYRQVPDGLVDGELVYEISRRHRLVPANPAAAVLSFRSIAACGIVGSISEDGEQIATVIVSGILDGESADLDIIPVSKHFRRPKARGDELLSVMRPLLRELFETHRVRRLSAAVPASRRRAISALEALGFAHEGVKRYGVVIDGEDPEDLVLMGLLAGDHK